MRVCAISLPELRIELVKSALAQSADASPLSLALAVVVAPPPMTETKLLGNTRLSVVSREARALGVLPGQTIAQARARAGDLSVRVVRPDAVRDVLARIAEVGLAFGATVSFGMAGEEFGGSSLQPQTQTPSLLSETKQASSSGAKHRKPARNVAPHTRSAAQKKPESDFGDVVWIDVTGCAHLHAPSSSASIFDGETILASRLAGVIASLGHTCSVAIADGPRVAAMLARATAESAARAKVKRATNAQALLLLEPTIVRPGDNATAIGPLPVSALPLPAEDVRWLAKIGVRTIHELRGLPREGLGTRLGARARDVIALAFGEDRAPLTPYVPPEVPVEETELEYGIEGTQALTFVAKTLTDRLASRLQGRAVAAARVELELYLDAAMLRDLLKNDTAQSNDDAPSSKRTTRETTAATTSTRPEIEIVTLDLPAPLSSASDLLAALRPKIERLVLCAPVLRAKLRAPILVHKRAAALSLFEPQPKAERALPRLVAELVSDLGPEAVSKLVLGDSWVPEDRSRLCAFQSTPQSVSLKKRRHMLSSVPEPSRLLAEPRHVARENVRVTRHLTRLETVEWWKQLPTAPNPTGENAARRPIDYVQGWVDGGLAWIEIDRTSGVMWVRGWFD